MYFSIIVFPIFSIIFLLCINRYLGNKGTAIISTLFLGISSLVVMFCFFDSGYQNSFIDLTVFPWFSILSLELNWSFYFDNLNLTILLMITSVSFLIHLYAMEYFSSDPHQSRFMIYLTCFTGSMIILVSSHNLFQLFLGWELIGLFSYLLINFWFSWIEANKSSIKAMIINRIGDFFLSISFFLFFFSFKSLDFSTINALSIELNNFYINLGFYNVNLIESISFFLFLGISAKSAQVPFHSWLVNAMSAPSPVSALIHAATLVTSGIFLILKFSHVIEISYSLIMISLIGIFTALFSGLTALVQNDSKRIIAYSTCSQLGYMAFSCGLSQYHVSFFRLINHGCFKALLFLGIGSLIHNIDNKQDIRNLGNLIMVFPSNYSMFLIGSLTLAGIPFLSGFYSKDTIIEISFVNYSFHGFSIYFFSLFIAILTTIYSTRLIYLVYLKNSNLNKLLFRELKDSGLCITITLIILSFLSIFNGYFFSDLFVGIGSDFFNTSLFLNSQHYSILNAEFQNSLIKNLPFLFSVIFITFTIIIYNQFTWHINKKNDLFYDIYLFLCNKWFFDYLQNKFSFFILSFSRNITFKSIDKGILEALGPSALKESFRSSTLKFTNFQSGYLYHYLVTLFLSWFLFLTFLSLNIKMKNFFILIFNILMVN